MGVVAHKFLHRILSRSHDAESEDLAVLDRKLHYLLHDFVLLYNRPYLLYSLLVQFVFFPVGALHRCEPLPEHVGVHVAVGDALRELEVGGPP